MATKVAGQGDQVDAGGALAQILNGIVDAIPENPELPIATKNTLGVIKVGDNLDIDSAGKLSASPSGIYVPGSLGAPDGSIYPFVPDDINDFNKAYNAYTKGVPVVIGWLESGDEGDYGVYRTILSASQDDDGRYFAANLGVDTTIIWRG